MNSKHVASILSVLLIASFLAVGLTIHSASATTATLSIPSVTETSSSVGSTFTVPVQVNNIANLFGFDINITWDNTLITFSSLDNSSLSTVWPQGYFEPLSPSPQTGTGYARLAAVATGGSGFTSSGLTTLFTLTFTIVKADNFALSTPLHFFAVKLSDSNANSIPVTTNDGTYTMNATTPGITFTLINPNPSKPYEYGKYIEVQVYATNIVSTLTGYDLRVDYSSEYLTFVQVQPETYVLTTPTVDTSTSGVVHLSVSSGGNYVGSSGLLFTLTFEISFAPSYTTIWRSNSTNQLTATVWLDTTTGNLAFTEGTIPIGSVTAPAPLTVTFNLIQGDVACTGQVNILDLRDVAAYYDQSTLDGAPAALYDIKIDSNNIIDIYDLVEVAANFGYYHPDTVPAS